MLVRNLIPTSARLSPRVSAMVKQGLPVGIVLLGARLDFYDLLSVALHVLVGVDDSDSGGDHSDTADVAVLQGGREAGPADRRRDGDLRELSDRGLWRPFWKRERKRWPISIGVINVLGVIAMLLFPVAGSILNLDATTYGVWCGLGIHATPQVIAAGFAHTGDGQVAGEMATIVKLVRISLLGPAVFLLGAWYAYRRRTSTYNADRVHYSKLVPSFVVLFLDWRFFARWVSYRR